MKKTDVKLVIFTMICCIIASTPFLLGSATFTRSEQNIWGQSSYVKKLTVIVTPVVAADVNASERLDDANAIYGILQRIVISADGNDTAFGVYVRDEAGRTIFTKTDCNTLELPKTYTFYLDDTEGNPHPGIPVAGRIYVDVYKIAYTAEQQTIQITSDANDPNGGTFELAYGDYNTSPIAYDANAAEVEAALEALTGITDVNVDGNDLPGDANIMTVIFDSFNGEDIGLLTIDVSNLTADTNDATIAGVITETVPGDWLLNSVPVDLYYYDPSGRKY